MSRRLVRLRAAVLAVLAALGAFAAQGCGPSPLARAYESFRGAVEPRLEDEARFWNEIAAMAADQDDDAAARRFRGFLGEKALPYYAELAKAFSGLDPGHERLAPARESLIAYAKARTVFVELQVRHVDFRAKVPELAAVQRAQEAANEARDEYTKLLGDEVPDSAFNAAANAVVEFLDGPYAQAISGRLDAAEALVRLRKEYLPRVEELRGRQYQATAQGKALRRHVVASAEFLALVEKELPTVVEVMRAKSRVEEAIGDADRHRAAFQKVFREVKRDM